MALITGTGDDDLLPGTSDHDVIDGLGGNDTLVADGTDTIDGGDGLDRVTVAGAQGAWIGTVGAVGADFYSVFSTAPNAFQYFWAKNVEAWQLTSFSDAVSVIGSHGMALLGMGGNDTLTGGDGDDLLDGGDDDDLFLPSAGDDSVIGGLGNDTLSFEDADAAVIGSIAGGFEGDGFSVAASGVETIVGSSFDDDLEGDAEANDIRGGAGDDTIAGGGGGNDTLSGDAGDDVLVADLGSHVSGGEGNDTLDLSHFTSAIVVVGSFGGTFIAVGGASLTADGVERLVATDQADVIDMADSSLSEVETLGGDDSIAGSLLIEPFSPGQTIDGGTGNDTVIGSVGNDVIHASEDDDLLDGGEGYDKLSLQRLVAGANVDLEAGESGGGAGNDTLSNFEEVIGSAFGDTLLGSEDTTLGDTLFGEGGNDFMDGRGGNDVLGGGAGGDSIMGGAGIDYISGGDGDDTVLGGVGNDVLFDDLGDDSVDGGEGNDILQMTSGGWDIVLGGTGNDSVWVQLDPGTADTIEGGDGFDFLVLELVPGFPAGHDGLHIDFTIGQVLHATSGSQLAFFSGFERASGAGGDDYLRGDDAANTLEGQGGSDLIEGGLGNDTLLGGDGADTLDGGDGVDLLSFKDHIIGVKVDLEASLSSTDDMYTGFEGLAGGSGDDRLRGDANRNHLLGNDGDDVLIGRGGNDTLEGGLGEDILLGGNGNDTYVIVDAAAIAIETGPSGGTDTVRSWITTALGSDIENLVLLGAHPVDGTGNSLANRMTGSNGGNTLAGGAGNDTLNGGGGNDVLVGGLGKDLLAGGTGQDVYDFDNLSEMGRSAATRDVISGFVSGQDKIDLSSLDANTATAANNAFRTFVVGGAFSGTFSTTAALYYDSSAKVLYGNTDGDAAAEFAIQIGGTGLAAGDLIL